MSETQSVIYIPDVAQLPVGVPVPPGLAPLASPAFTGEPTAPTPAPGIASGRLATTAFVLDALARAAALRRPPVYFEEFVAAALQPSPGGSSGQSRASGNSANGPGGHARFVALVATSADGILTLVNEDYPALTSTFPVKAGTSVRLTAQAFGSSFHATFAPSGPATVTLITGYGPD